MAVELIADPGEEGVNAYATVDEAIAYAESLIPDANTRAFLDLDEEQMSQALITAYRQIESTVGYSYDLEDGAFPADIVEASIVLGISKAPLFADGATGDALAPDIGNGNVKSERVEGAVAVEYFEPRGIASGIDLFPQFVRDIISRYVISSAGAWGSAVVQRGS